MENVYKFVLHSLHEILLIWIKRTHPCVASSVHYFTLPTTQIVHAN